MSSTCMAPQGQVGLETRGFAVLNAAMRVSRVSRRVRCARLASCGAPCLTQRASSAQVGQGTRLHDAALEALGARPVNLLD